MAEAGRLPPVLKLCRGCRQFVRPGSPSCPFCGGDLAALEAEHDARKAEVAEAAKRLRAALERIGSRAGR